MQKIIQQKISILFTILFLAIVCAPSIIMSIDDSIDISYVLGENEEEGKESFKLLFEINPHNFEDSFVDSSDDHNIGYTFKTYPKPHLNLIFPPPDFI